MHFASFPAIAMLVSALAWAPPAPAADSDRGRILYEARCMGCHTESVHGREKRAATDFESARAWVRRWGENLGLAWADDDVNDVTVHLNLRYYRFRCPATVCKATGYLDNAAAQFAAVGGNRLHDERIGGDCHVANPANEQPVPNLNRPSPCVGRLELHEGTVTKE